MALPPLQTIPRTLAATVVLTIGLAGCGLFDDDAAPPPPTTAPRSTTTTTAPRATSEPPELLDPGAEPRRVVRVSYTEGDEATITFTSDLEIAQVTEGRTQRLDSPPITQTLTYTVGAVSDAGAAITIRVDAIGVDAEGTGLGDGEVADLEARLAPMIGFVATGTVTPLGELTDLGFAATDGLPEALSAQLDALEGQLGALGPALPVEPVGVGASWRTTATRPTGGADVEATSTITVTALDDRLLSYTSSITTAADPQDIALEGLADATTARLLSSDLTGSATGTMGLDTVALTLRTRLDGEQELVLTSAGGTTALTQQLAIAYVATTATA